MSSRHLANNSVLPLSPQSNLLSPSDLRSNNCFHVNSYEKRRNITASFDTGSLHCTTCLPKIGHQLLEKVNSRSSHSYKSPAVFILSDQSFPASLPTGGDGECLHVLRLEDPRLPTSPTSFSTPSNPSVCLLARLCSCTPCPTWHGSARRPTPRTWSEPGSASVGHIELAFWYFTYSPSYRKVARTRGPGQSQAAHLWDI